MTSLSTRFRSLLLPTACLVCPVFLGCDEPVALHDPDADDAGVEVSIFGGTGGDTAFPPGATLPVEDVLAAVRLPEPEPVSSSGTRYLETEIGGPPVVHPGSCGDRLTNTAAEECDDGDGAENGPDACSAACQVTDMLAVATDSAAAPDVTPRRSLGHGRHPIAAGEAGFAIVTQSTNPPDESTAITLSLFDTLGKRIAVVRIDDELDFPTDAANPVVAALPGGDYAVLWTDLAADGDDLGIAMRRVSGSGVVDPTKILVSAGTGFSQYDPDAVWTDAGLVVAWADDASFETAPDLRFRVFDRALVPLGTDEALATLDAVEGNVALAARGSDWAAAWRADGGRGESVEARSNDGERWSLNVNLAAAAEDRPALTPVSDGDWLVAFTERVADPQASSLGALNLAQLTVGSKDVTRHTVAPLLPHDDSDGDGSGPNAPSPAAPNLVTTLDGSVYVAWQSDAPSDSANRRANGDDVWLKRVAVDGKLDLGEPEIGAPRYETNQHGDQRTLALAAAGDDEVPRLVSAWDDYGLNVTVDSARRDVVVQYARVPHVRAAKRRLSCTDGNGACGNGEGHCSADEECVTGLLCFRDTGALFDLPADFSTCIAPHCGNGLRDLEEEDVDCGGIDCGHCPEPAPAQDSCADGCRCEDDAGCSVGDECRAACANAEHAEPDAGAFGGAGAALGNGASGSTAAGGTGGDAGSGEATDECGRDPSARPSSTEDCSLCPCAALDGPCADDSECTTGLCVVAAGPVDETGTATNRCMTPECANGRKDVDETLIDCGGTCGSCYPPVGPITILEPTAGEVYRIHDAPAGDLVLRFQAVPRAASYTVAFVRKTTTEYTLSLTPEALGCADGGICVHQTPVLGLGEHAWRVIAHSAAGKGNLFAVVRFSIAEE